MPHLSVGTTIDAAPDVVWGELAAIPRHVEWMADAVAIRFHGDLRQGVGTTFECETKVGPLRTLDRMEVTSWAEGREIGVRHSGLITGEGRFRMDPAGGDRTEVTWTEDLAFPWYLGGPATALFARPILRRIWQGNLRRLAALCEDDTDTSPSG
jgi:hypothetical protein